jgi:hypothetical protein
LKKYIVTDLCACVEKIINKELSISELSAVLVDQSLCFYEGGHPLDDEQWLNLRELFSEIITNDSEEVDVKEVVSDLWDRDLVCEVYDLECFDFPLIFESIDDDY